MLQVHSLPVPPPEDEGITELTLFLDQETLLQTGSILRDAKGELIAEYWFSDLVLNPEFTVKQFRREGV